MGDAAWMLGTTVLLQYFIWLAIEPRTRSYEGFVWSILHAILIGVLSMPLYGFLSYTGCYFGPPPAAWWVNASLPAMCFSLFLVAMLVSAFSRTRWVRLQGLILGLACCSWAVVWHLPFLYVYLFVEPRFR